MIATDDTRPIAVTMGEPAGIGGELSLMAWARRKPGARPFIVLDDAERLTRLAKKIGLDVPVRRICSPAEATSSFAESLPVIDRPLAGSAEPGQPSAATAADVLSSIREAVALVQAGACAAVVTNPIQKKPLFDAGFGHSGHTEFLGELAGAGARPVMMLACPELMVVPVTVHVPLSRVPLLLDTGTIVHAGRTTVDALRTDFGIDRPRLAVAGLNPHAGEDGSIGDEEVRVIGPAIDELRTAGIAVAGPVSADSLFHAVARERYDAALCMYHDQALIPLKTINFDTGVNITLGLPFIRTSPDHGTALDIAGTGKASPASFIAALELAERMIRNRSGSRRG